MFRILFLALLLTVLFMDKSFADVRYVQRTDNYPFQEINQSENVPPDVQYMIRTAPTGSYLTTVNYIKGTKKRVDYEELKISTITLCEQKQFIEINHNTRTYDITSLDDWANYKQNYCKLQPGLLQPKKAERGQLYVKVTTKAGNKTQVVNGYQAKKYIKETFISGDPDCEPDIDIIENIWVTDLGIEPFQCPLMNSFSNCSIPVNVGPCFQDALLIRSGATQLPGTVVKSQIRIYYPGQTMYEFDDPTVDYATDDILPELDSFFYNYEMAQTTWDTAGQVVFTSKMMDVSTDPLTDDLFEIPQGYVKAATTPLGD